MKSTKKGDLLHIFQMGYSLANYPLGIFTTLTTIYYLAVNNLPFLKAIFPQFWIFLVVGMVVGIPACLFIGQLYIGSPLNKASTRKNPFSQRLVPTQFSMYQAVSKMARKEGFIAEADELDALIEASRSEW